MKEYKYNKKIHEFLGQVTGKFQDTLYDTKENIYRLRVKLENNNSVDEFQVRKSLVENSVWEKVVNSDYIDKRYLFFCDKITSTYRLKNWKELPKN